jgi:hypothetical protein
MLNKYLGLKIKNKSCFFKIIKTTCWKRREQFSYNYINNSKVSNNNLLHLTVKYIIKVLNIKQNQITKYYNLENIT